MEPGFQIYELPSKYSQDYVICVLPETVSSKLSDFFVCTFYRNWTMELLETPISTAAILFKSSFSWRECQKSHQISRLVTRHWGTWWIHQERPSRQWHSPSTTNTPGLLARDLRHDEVSQLIIPDDEDVCLEETFFLTRMSLWLMTPFIMYHSPAPCHHQHRSCGSSLGVWIHTESFTRQEGVLVSCHSEAGVFQWKTWKASTPVDTSFCPSVWQNGRDATRLLSASIEPVTSWSIWKALPESLISSETKL